MYGFTITAPTQHDTRPQRALVLAGATPYALLRARFPIYWLTNNLALLTSDRFAAGLADLLIVSSGVAVLTLLIGVVARCQAATSAGKGYCATQC